MILFFLLPLFYFMVAMFYGMVIVAYLMLIAFGYLIIGIIALVVYIANELFGKRWSTPARPMPKKPQAFFSSRR